MYCNFIIGFLEKFLVQSGDKDDSSFNLSVVMQQQVKVITSSLKLNITSANLLETNDKVREFCPKYCTK